MDDSFRHELMATFRAEAEEHLSAISAGVVALEKPGLAGRFDVLSTVFREAHSLKGAARAVGLTGVESVCQAIETAFAAMRAGGDAVSEQGFDAVHEALSVVQQLVAEPDRPVPLSATVARLAAMGDGAQHPVAALPSAATRDEPGTPGVAGTETVRVSAVRLDGVLMMVEDLVSAKLAAAQRADEARALGDGAAALAGRLGLDARSLGAAVDGLREEVRTLLAVPFQVATRTFPAMVRNLCRERGKEADLVVIGADVEVDRHVLDDLKDPLIHLLRNAVDHGLEPPAAREASGKPRRGEIRLAVRRVGGDKVEVVVSDDGAGIDLDRVKAAARGMGPDGTEGRDMDLIFAAGVTTSGTVTGVSGRGLGLAIVREKVARLAGSVEVDTAAGRGTSFRILLPVTRVVDAGLLVRAAGRRMVLPLASVDRVARVAVADVKTVEGRPTVLVDGAPVPLAGMAAMLGLPPRPPGDREASWMTVVVASAGHARAALRVDEIEGETEVRVRPFPPPLCRVRNVVGATVLGSGELVPVLDARELVVSAAADLPAAADAEGARHAPSCRGTVLVAEDSITSRMLLQQVLEAAGWHVSTAVDGMDALTALKAGDFDLVVSDVDMPRMNGFDLTARIRGDERLAHLPVVLVTALDSREDRERGIGIGANAYIVKSAFDQDNLLEVMARLA